MMMATENLEPMMKVVSPTYILTEFISVAVTTDFNLSLGWTTQIHGGMHNKKLWIAKTFKRAVYYHEMAVDMVLKDPNRNSLGPEDESQIQI
jgi:hypothetical protein